MNYIKQLTFFFDKSVSDTGFSPTHLSLFMALFQRWNQAHFGTSIQINRDDIMRLAKVQSKATYHRCMRYLHQQGYIDYQPSYNPLKGSCIRFFPAGSVPTPEPVQSAETRLIKEPYNKQYSINHTIEIDQKKEDQELVRSFVGENVGTGVGPDPVVAGRFEKEKSSAKKEKDIPPRSALVEQFFAGQGSTAAEASRFINHYTANGWLVGGKSPMIDWRASARNWISNSLNFNGHGKYQSTHRAQQLSTRTDKSYHEPL